jgi:hypothetical protein
MLYPGRTEDLGTFKVKLGNSPTAAAAFLNDGTRPKIVEQKSARVQQIRPVGWNGFCIFCEEENRYVFIGDVARIHLDSMVAFIRPYYADWPSQAEYERLNSDN